MRQRQQPAVCYRHAWPFLSVWMNSLNKVRERVKKQKSSREKKREGGEGPVRKPPNPSSKRKPKPKPRAYAILNDIMVSLASVGELAQNVLSEVIRTISNFNYFGKYFRDVRHVLLLFFSKHIFSCCIFYSLKNNIISKHFYLQHNIKSL